MGYKIVQDAPEQKRYCEYIQNKLDIARKYGAVYELSDEDLRIQRLYDDKRLEPVDKIRTISRVKAMEDNNEYITVSKNVEFRNKISKTYHDKYTDIEGVTEIPLRITNEAGEEESSQLQLVYTIPFSKQKAKELIKRARGTGSNTKFRFYTGPVTANRPIIDPMIIGNSTTFVEATWDELVLGREKKVISSKVNRLEDIRKEMKNSENEDNTFDELNKEEEGSTSEGEIDTIQETKPTTTVRVKGPSNTTSNKNN